ncbi:MAG: GNAT family N-acetyltransferase [Bacteroidia bacterium]|nr:GNAT family N-acetyltransferase [Bacteroidia bacterium]
MVQIKEAAANDANLLCQLGAQTFEQAYGDVKDANDISAYIIQAFIATDIAHTISGKQATYFIAYFNNEAIGYTKLRTDRLHENLNPAQANLELERIYVCKEFWKQQVGAALMQHAIMFGKQNNFDVLWLGVWQQNHRAIAFYKKMGFEIIGTKKFYVGTEENDDYVMQVKL